MAGALLGLSRAYPPLTGQVSADVAIVGSGFSALWAAAYLVQAQPSLRIVLVDAQPTGSHARAGRGVGLTSLTARVPSRFGRLQGALIETVDELFAVLENEAIDARANRGGSLRVARNPAQERRLAALARGQERWGAPLEWLEGSALRDRVHIDGASAATWWPHTATVEPGAVSGGLAAALRRRGVRIFAEPRCWTSDRASSAPHWAMSRPPSSFGRRTTPPAA